MPNAVRIYVAYHPDTTIAPEICKRIYRWFRTDRMDGIPVYVRTSASSGSEPTTLPYELDETLPQEIRGKSLEYIVPLVDSHMVRDIQWRGYLNKIAAGSITIGEKQTNDGKQTTGTVVLPVALDSNAFNLPDKLSGTNFIRFNPSDSDCHDELIKQLTEAMTRDLSGRVTKGPKRSDKVRIFISYARMDGTEVPIKLRDYIQSNTQCSAFFDENDIAFGKRFKNEIDDNLEEDSVALIVIQGDHYADRPWCRYELSTFQKPKVIRPEKNGDGRTIFCFSPTLVVDCSTGGKPSRVIPELANATRIRWRGESSQARDCFSLLLREALFGIRHILQGPSVKGVDPGNGDVVVNRLPGSIGLQTIISDCGARVSQSSGRRNTKIKSPGKTTIHYPGNGMPALELALLREHYSNLEFKATCSLDTYLPEKMKKWLGLDDRFPLKKHMVSVSASDTKDMQLAGYLPEHLNQVLVHLLRPLVLLGADLIYGGLPPTDSGLLPEKFWKKGQMPPHNFTNILLNLVAAEDRQLEGGLQRKRDNLRPLRLFNPSVWPDFETLTPVQEAQWINRWTCLPITKEMAGFGNANEQELKDHGALARAVALSVMRERLFEGSLEVNIPDSDLKPVVMKPLFHIVVGGKRRGFSGVMPGVIEESIFALQNKTPLFILGGLGGAAGLLADAILAFKNWRTNDSASKRHLLKIQRKLSTAAYRTDEKYRIMLDSFDVKPRFIKIKRSPEQAFDLLWESLEPLRGGNPNALRDLFANGLSDEENETLLTQENTNAAVQLAWQGMERVMQKKGMAPRAKPPETT